MLNFDETHKVADLSAIDHKKKIAKTIGKVVLSGVLISSTIFLSGCFGDGTATEKIIPTTSMIIKGKEKSVVVSVKQDHIYGGSKNFIKAYTINGDVIVVSTEDVIIIEGQNSYQKAEMLAKELGEEDEIIVAYDEIVSSTDSKQNIKK